ncbi:type IV pilus assembly protein PilM, partial [bacterium]|nr:type IV pilus assembly protein PilM [bacterium]
MDDGATGLSLGLDLGSGFVKLAALARSGEGWSLRHVALAPLPEGAIVDGDIMDAGAVAGAIESLFTALELQETEVVAAISGRAVIVKPIRIPTTNPDDLALSVSWEAEQYLPNLDDVNLDYHVIGSGEDFTEVLLVAAKRERIESLLLILRLAGLEAAAVDVDSFALGNCYELNNPEQSNDTVALVNVGSSLTNVNILSDGSPRFTRDITFGGANYTEAVARELSLSMTEAEAAKRWELTLVDHEALQAVLDTVSGELISELSRSLTHFTNANPERPIERLILTGGSGQIANLDALIAEGVSLPVERLNPLAQIDLTESGLDTDEL